MLSISKIRKSVSLGEVQSQSSVPAQLMTTGKKVQSNMKFMDALSVPTEQFLKIYCRIRPLEQRHPDQETHRQIYEVLPGDKTIRINMEESVIAKNGGGAEFGFNGVLGQESSQQEVFETVCRPMLEEMLGGVKGVQGVEKNGLVFTYGVTNSGKTHTTVGQPGHPHLQGLLPNLLEYVCQLQEQLHHTQPTPQIPTASPPGDIFDRLCVVHPPAKASLLAALDVHALVGRLGGSHVKMSVWLESFEIYNEQIKDLLNNQRASMKEMSRVEVVSLESALGYLEQALGNRSISTTLLNTLSSRSHTVFQIGMLFSTPLGEVPVKITVCDLAGSERADRTGNRGSQLREAGNINKSLMTLNKCISALAQGRLVPYRESKLTLLLCSFFKSSNNLLAMIANINPHVLDFEETMRVLDFTSQAKKSQPIRSTIDISWKAQPDQRNQLNEKELVIQDLRMQLLSIKRQQEQLLDSLAQQRTDQLLGKSRQDMQHFIDGLSRSAMDSAEQKNIFREICQHFSQKTVSTKGPFLPQQTINMMQCLAEENNQQAISASLEKYLHRKQLALHSLPCFQWNHPNPVLLCHQACSPTRPSFSSFSVQAQPLLRSVSLQTSPLLQPTTTPHPPRPSVIELDPPQANWPVPKGKKAKRQREEQEQAQKKKRNNERKKRQMMVRKAMQAAENRECSKKKHSHLCCGSYFPQ